MAAWPTGAGESNNIAALILRSEGERTSPLGDSVGWYDVHCFLIN